MVARRIALYVVTTLQAPFFHRPRDILANAIISAFMLFTIDLAGIQRMRTALNFFRWVSSRLLWPSEP